MKEIIKKINGYEIIEFFNSLNEEIDDTSIEINSFVFESQNFENGEYKLAFSTSFNNWGTSQTIEDNYLQITEDFIRVIPNEPHDGDGSDEILEALLLEWLPTHNFATDYKEQFEGIIREQVDSLNEIQYGDSKELFEIIKNLTKATTLIK